MEILDDSEIDIYLQDFMNVEKEKECLDYSRWPEDIKKKVEELKQLKIIGNNPIRRK